MLAIDMIKEYCNNRIEISSKYVDIENHTVVKCYKELLKFIEEYESDMKYEE